MLLKGIKFKKMQGSGNDFILIDNRSGLLKARDFSKIAKVFCKRHFGIGADGLIIIEDSKLADFKWHFFNADGSSAEMCGNGGRCAARFAYLQSICKEKLVFETLAGLIEAEVKGSKVKLQLTPPADLKEGLKIEIDGEKLDVDFVNTGVPHAVVLVKDANKVDVRRVGKAIRNHEIFAPSGTNVNFVSLIDNDQLLVRTYERGVEDETHACGTGSVASALIAYKRKMVDSPVKVITSGGEELLVYIDPSKPDQVYLEGDAILVYSGEVEELSI